MKETKKRDVARNTILILIVLVVLISVISTWVILNTIDFFKYQQTRAATNQKGYVNIEILPRPGETRVTGGVALNILPRPS